MNSVHCIARVHYEYTWLLALQFFVRGFICHLLCSFHYGRNISTILPNLFFSPRNFHSDDLHPLKSRLVAFLICTTVLRFLNICFLNMLYYFLDIIFPISWFKYSFVWSTSSRKKRFRGLNFMNHSFSKNLLILPNLICLTAEF